MAATQPPLIGADAIYRAGLETLVSHSGTIVAGSIAHYSKRVVSMSEPGPGAIPLKWIVTGTVEHPKVLKGTHKNTPVVFSRSEQSPVIPRDISIPEWELQYGDLDPQQPVVLFLQGDVAAPIVKVLPNGSDQPGLIELVSDVVKIQALGKGAQVDAWLGYIAEGKHPDRIEIATRSLLSCEIAWEKLEPSALQLMRNPAASSSARSFVYGAIVFWLTQGKWKSDANRVVSFLCQTFAAEHDEQLALAFVLQMKQILRYADIEKSRPERQALREQILHCLRTTPAQGTSVELQYNDILVR